KSFDIQKTPPEQYSALPLAYIGDCVYELYVRSYLVKDANNNVNDLHKKATRFVCCKAQSEFFHKIEGILSEKELSIFKRGRNTKSQVPKNASMSDYRNATGVETLIGFLYLSGETDRITELLKHIFI
ncbi:MAG: ribonuclease III domain-containing protein, partial [Oscillospiraceae bacterium]